MKKHRFRLQVIVMVVCMRVVLPGDSCRAQSSANDAGWPRQVTKNGTSLVYYQPQLINWKDYKELSAAIAFALTPKGGQEVHGAATIQCGTLVDKEAHTAYLRDITATSIRFPSLDEATAEKNSALFRELFPTGGETISVDRLIADLDQQKQPANTVVLKNDPPVIFYSAGPAILLTILGEPVLTSIAKTDLQFIVNTNWDLFFEKSKKRYFLLAEQQWLTADALKGPWTATKTLPKDMSKLPAGENFDDVKKMVPPAVSTAAAPQVFYSTEPAELIVFKGAPVYTKIDGTQLLYVSNTDNDIFLDNSGKQFYVLLSGRWFSSKELNGPWVYAGNDLPADFSKIPEKSAKANVLASVPGTVQASDAVLLAQIPTTAIVNKKEAEAKVKVNYDGDPQFKPIDGTSLQYASNTQEKVIRVGDLYYLCFQAVWFVSTKASGPWKTADTVPQEIYTIPPSSPVYNVTYVTQTNATATTVESSSTAGYFGAFIIGMTVGAVIAYGTGWYYPPYMFWGAGMLYPIYRPWPCTYGAGYVYNPWTGGFAGGRRVYGPYGAAGSSAWYNPATGRYGRSASVQGWYGGRTVAQSYNPWTGGYARTSQGHNAYAQWGNSVAERGGQWVQTGHVTTAHGTALGYRTSTGQQGVIAHGANGTVIKGDNGVYAGHDGNVYKRNGQGNWSEYSKGGGWQQVKPANLGGATQHEGVLGGLNNSAQARQRGQMQTQRFRTMQRGGGGFRRGR